MSKPPLELLPASEAVPPDRIVPVTVFQCNGSSGPPMIYGVQIRSNGDTSARTLLAKSMQAVGLSEEPRGGILLGQPREQRNGTRDECASFLHASDSWSMHRPLVMVVPAVTKQHRGLLGLEYGRKKTDPARLVVYLHVPSLVVVPSFTDARRGTSNSIRPIGPPVVFIVTRDCAKGGKRAEAEVQQGVKAGMKVPSATLQDCTRWIGGEVGLQSGPFAQRSRLLPVELGLPTAYMAATLTERAQASYDLSRLRHPAEHARGFGAFTRAADGRWQAARRAKRARGPSEADDRGAALQQARRDTERRAQRAPLCRVRRARPPGRHPQPPRACPPGARPTGPLLRRRRVPAVDVEGQLSAASIRCWPGQGGWHMEGGQPG
mmetsp:Transcript_35773/g.91328  ORF Transcript_35773/g.91328 Transcript_35773/m.91328 type:complete len:378 (-) Transcript_35773:460-1593(-)